MANKIDILTLVLRDGNRCHYCNRVCRVVKKPGGPLPDDAATREHVVPRSIGGRNNLINQVVACYRCNHDRGTTANPCDCRFCVNAYEQYYIYHFDALIKRNFDRIYKNPKSSKNPWVLRIDGNIRSFKTFQQAVAGMDKYYASIKSGVNL